MKTGFRGEYLGFLKNKNGDWRRLYNEELNNLYCPSNIVRVIKSRRLRLTDHVARMGQGRNALKILTGKPSGKKPLGKDRHRWEKISEQILKKYVSI